MSISGLEKLDVWNKAQAFAVRVHKEILPILPVEEKYALSQQIRRSRKAFLPILPKDTGAFTFKIM